MRIWQKLKNPAFALIIFMRFTLNWKSFPILIKTFDLMQNAAAVQHKNENKQTMGESCAGQMCWTF